MNKTRKTSGRKGFNITWIQRKKRSGGKERIFLKEEDQEKFQSALTDKKGYHLSWLMNWCKQRYEAENWNGGWEFSWFRVCHGMLKLKIKDQGATG